MQKGGTVFVRLSNVVANERNALKRAIEARIGEELDPVCFGGRLKSDGGDILTFKGLGDHIVRVSPEVLHEAREQVVREYRNIELESGAKEALRHFHLLYGDVQLVSDFCAPRQETTTEKVRRVRQFLNRHEISLYVNRVLLDGHQGFNACLKRAGVIVDNDWARLNTALGIAKDAKGIFYRIPQQSVGGETAQDAPYPLPRITEVQGWEAHPFLRRRAA